MTEVTITFSPLTAEPAFLAIVGEAVLAAQRQIVSAVIAAQLRMIGDITGAVIAAQRDVLDAMVQATIRRD